MKLNPKQIITIVDTIYRTVSIRKFVSRGRKIGMDIPLAEDLVSGSGSLSLYCSDSISLVAYWADYDEVIKWAKELGIDIENVEEFFE